MSAVSNPSFTTAASNGTTTRMRQPAETPLVNPYALGAFAPEAREAVRIQCAQILQRVHAWLEVVVPSVPQLATAIPAALRAVELYSRRQHEASLAQAVQVARTLEQTRFANPVLPPV